MKPSEKLARLYAKQREAEVKEITKEEQLAFEKELRAHLEAHVQFGPFDKKDTYRWFFLRGLDVARELKPGEITITKERLLQAFGAAYCHGKNTSKVLDEQVAFSLVKELFGEEEMG